MDPTISHLLELIQQNRGRLIQESTDISFLSGSNLIPRDSAEQMLHGVVAILEEALRGESSEFRKMFLETALPAVVEAGQTSWADMLQNGLPCWGVLLGRLLILVKEPHRDAALSHLSRVMGEWWRDVSLTVLPLYKERGEL